MSDPRYTNVPRKIEKRSELRTERSFMLSGILFDLVGTLIEESSNVLNTAKDYYETQVKAIHRSLEKDGISVDWNSFKNQYNKVRNRQKEESERTFREYDMCERVSETLGFLNYNFSSTSDIIQRAADAYMDVYINSLRINQSTCGILRTLAAEYTLGLVTNFAYPPGAYRILHRFGLQSFFKAVVVSGEVGWKKPSRRIFETALSRLSLKPEEAIFVGDDYEVDIVGAKKVGMKTVLICKEPVGGKESDITIESVMDILSLIKRL